MAEQYRLFFSWQNDRKDTKKVIFAALRKVEEALKKEGLELFIDQDTRERVGKRNIDAEVLEKIRKCDIFVADLTPIITYNPPADSHDLPKLMPNSNVMYEYGYALHAKGENRMIVLASLNKEDNEHIEFMPFDVNHDTITLFSDEKSLGGLYGWIRKIIEDVDKERAAVVPQYACLLHFLTEDPLYADEITIHPKFRRTYYTVETHHSHYHDDSEPVSIAEAFVDPFKMQRALIDQFRVPAQVQRITAKVTHKTTNYSYVPVSLVFTNQGTEALDNVKLRIMASDSRVVFDDTNERHSIPMPIPRGINDTAIGDKMISQYAATINPNDSVFLSPVYIRAPHDIGTFFLTWSVGTRTFQEEGFLTIHVEPEYDDDWVANDELAGTERVDDYKVSE